MNYNVKLHTAIKERGLSQREFARVVGDHETIVSRVVNGWFVLDAKRREKYAKYLGRKPEELFD